MIIRFLKNILYISLVLAFYFIVPIVLNAFSISPPQPSALAYKLDRNRYIDTCYHELVNDCKILVDSPDADHKDCYEAHSTDHCGFFDLCNRNCDDNIIKEIDEWNKNRETCKHCVEGVWRGFEVGGSPLPDRATAYWTISTTCDLLAPVTIPNVQAGGYRVCSLSGDDEKLIEDFLNEKFPDTKSTVCPNPIKSVCERKLVLNCEREEYTKADQCYKSNPVLSQSNCCSDDMIKQFIIKNTPPNDDTLQLNPFSAFLPISGGFGENINNLDVNAFLQDVLTYGSAVLGGLAVLKIIFGGVMYATAAGNAQRISDAKSHILYALIGVALIAGANIILWLFGATNNIPSP